MVSDSVVGAGGEEVPEVPRADEGGGGVLRGGGRGAGSGGVHEAGVADDIQALPEPAGRGGGAAAGGAPGARREGRRRRRRPGGGRDGQQGGDDAQAAGARPVPEAAQGVPGRRSREPAVEAAARAAGARRLHPPGLAVRTLPASVISYLQLDLVNYSIYFALLAFYLHAFIYVGLMHTIYLYSQCLNAERLMISSNLLLSLKTKTNSNVLTDAESYPNNLRIRNIHAHNLLAKRMFAE